MISFVRRASREQTLFFGVLLVLVVLGDGKQPIGDVVAAAGILSMFLLQRIKGKTTFHIPLLLNATWAALLLYLIGRTVFSDSAGYSVSATVRWVMAYLVFVFFSSRGQEGHKGKEGEIFSHWLLGFGVVIVLMSCMATIFAGWGRSLPGMNLLYPTFGHNHVVNIIVFMFPLVLYQLLRKKNLRSSLLAIFFGLALIFSFARGAWLLMFGYLCYFFFTHRMFSIRTKRIVVGGLAIIGAAALTLILFSKNLSGQLRDWPTLRRQLVKTSALESRLPYWKQAAAAVRERPFFGAGPGTFYLLSKRFQEAPAAHSWYAHSFPLELAAEIGLIGLIGAIWLTGYILRGAARGPLFHSVVLTLIYSLYEINLNFLVVWLLFWAALGMLYTGQSRPRRGYLPGIALAVLVVFYLSSVAASALGLFSATRPYAFYAEPYVASRAIVRLNDPNTRPPDAEFIDSFHKNDPEVLIAFAKDSKKTDTAMSIQFYRRAIAADPQNVEYVSDFTKYLAEDGNVVETGRMIQALSVSHLLRESLPSFSQVDFSKDQLLPLYTKELFGDVGKPTNMKEFLAKTYYLLGLALIDKDPEQTRDLWTLARDSAPEWGYFPAELASLYFYNFHEEQNAKQVLIDCQKDVYARKLCKETLGDIGAMPGAGTYKKEIGGIQ